MYFLPRREFETAAPTMVNTF